MSALWDKVMQIFSRKAPTYECADGTLIRIDNVTSLGAAIKDGQPDKSDGSAEWDRNKFRVYLRKGGFVDLPHTEYDGLNSALICYDRRWALPDEPDYDPNA